MRLSLLFLFVFMIPTTMVAADSLGVGYVRCYGGDSCTFDTVSIPEVFGDKINVRVAGVDTPLIRGKCELEKSRAREARDFVRATLAGANQIDLMSCKRGKYFRLVCKVIVDGKDLAETLMERGYARKYDGGERGSWCH